MPELRNHRWERFAQAIAFGLDMTQTEAYKAAGYKATGNSAEVNACKLLSITKPVVERVRELQLEQKAVLAKKHRFTVEGIAKRMALASELAEQDRNAAAITGAESAIAKLLGVQVERSEVGKPGDFSNNTSTIDIAVRVLADAGAVEPSPAQIAMAQEELARHARAIEAIASDTATAAVQA